jgi:hypothetical protein
MPNIITSRTQASYLRPPMGGVVLNRGSILAQGLVAWFPLNESKEYPTGGTGAVRDISGYSNHLDTLSVYPVNLHQDGGFCTLHGSGGGSDYRMTRATPIITGAPCSMACWLKPNESGVNRDVLGVEHSSGYSIWMKTSSGAIQASYTDSSFGNSVANSSATYTSGVWCHAAVVFPTSNARYAYLNGANKGSETTSRGAVTLNSTSYAPRTYSGNLSDVCFWNRGLSDAEVYRLYEPGTRWELYYKLGQKIYFDMATTNIVTYPLQNINYYRRKRK